MKRQCALSSSEGTSIDEKKKRGKIIGNYRGMCRHAKDGKLFASMDTVCCFSKGCVCCAYKLVVEPAIDDLECSTSLSSKIHYRSNKRPGECLRESGEWKSNESMYSLRGTGCRLLTVGDGDLSFSLALAKQLKCHHLVATTHLSRQDLDAAYGASKTEDTIKQLTLLGVNVVHEVDATKLHLNSDVFSTNSSYDRIIWNFPCVAGRSSRQSDAQLEEIDINKELLEQFFSSVSSPGLLSRDGEVHVSHKAKPPFSHWNIKKCAVDGGRDSLSFIGNVVFDRSCFDGYETKKVATGSGSFPTWDALTYIWGKKSNVSKDPSPSMSPTVYPVLPDELLDIDLHPTTLKLARDLKASQKKKRKQGKQSNDMSIVTSDITLQVAGSHIVAIDDVFLDLVCRSLQLK